MALLAWRFVDRVLGGIYWLVKLVQNVPRAETFNALAAIRL